MKSAKLALRCGEATYWPNIIEAPGSHCYISGHNLSKLKHFADFLDTLVRKYQINFEFRPMPKSIFSLIFFSTWFVWWRKKGMYLCVREPFKNVLADFVRKGGTPPPYPLNGKSFCQKTLSGQGGYPPPLNGQSPKKFLEKWVKKG